MQRVMVVMLSVQSSAARIKLFFACGTGFHQSDKNKPKKLLPGDPVHHFPQADFVLFCFRRVFSLFARTVLYIFKHHLHYRSRRILSKF